MWSLIQQLSSRGTALGFFVILARLLDPEAFGLMASAAVFLAVSDLLMEQGFGKALIQRAELRPEHINTAFWAQVTVAVVVCVTGIILAPWLASLYGQPALVPVIRWLLLVTPITAIGSVQDSLVQRELGYKKLAQRQLAATFFGGVVGVIVALSGGGIWSLVFQQIISATTGTLLLWTVNPWRPGLQVSKAAFRDLLGFSVDLFFLRGIYVLKNRADHFLIALYLDPIALGFYVVAFRVVDTLTELCITPFSGLSLALFSRLQNDPVTLGRAYLKSVFAAAMLGFPASAGLAILSPELIALGFGHKWIGAVPLLQVLAFSIFYRSLNQANTGLLLANGRSRFRIVVGLVHIAVSTLLLVEFLRYGAVAASWIYVICNFLILPVTMWMSFRITKLATKDYFRPLLMPFIATLVMAALAIPLHHHLTRLAPAGVVLALTAIAGVGVYALTLWPLSSNFRQLAHDALGSLKTRLKRTPAQAAAKSG